IRLLDVKTGKDRHPAAGHQAAVGKVDVSPDGRLIATGGAGGQVRLWDARTGEGVRRWDTGRGGLIEHLAFAADGKHLSTLEAVSNVTQLWEVATGREVRDEESTAEGIGCALSGDGRLVAW